MAAQDQASRLPIAGLLTVLAAIVAALVWNRVALDPGRPAREKTQQHPRVVLQDIDARLWEDPFAVLSRHEQESTKAAPPANKTGKTGSAYLLTAERVCEEIGNTPSRRLLLLGVMLSNSPYLDASEGRSRTRYAVQSALSVAHFVPVDAQHIGYFESEAIRHADDTKLKVPFEVYRRKGGQKKTSAGEKQEAAGKDRLRYKVLVIWLEEEGLAAPINGKGAPLTSLSNVLKPIWKACGGNEAVEMAVIGPANSDTLRAMVQEVKSPPEAWRCEKNKKACRADAVLVLQNTRFYSPFATASGRDLLQLRDKRYAPCNVEGWLPEDWEDKRGLRGTGSLLNDYFWQCRIQFFSSVATDEELSKALVDELDLRGLHGLTPGDAGHESKETASKPTPAPDYYIALVSESDTYYGRMLPKALLRTLDMDDSCEDDPAELPDGAPPPGKRACRVLRYSYLRGLDGQIPPAGESKERKPKESPAEAEREAARLERGEGPRQFDYLRRLSTRIYEDSRRLQMQSGYRGSVQGAARDRVRAIGILGTDVYDKIAVLRALRQDFPRAVFFTTDLDARLLDGEQYKWARNLVVASSFGLELAPCVQKWVPPFRGTYQTSAYLSARLALYNAFSGEQSIQSAVLCPEYAPAGRFPFVDGERVKGSKLLVRVDQTGIDRWLGGPRVYEIGRRGVWDFSAALDANAPSVQPAVASFVPNPYRLVMGIGLALLLLLGLSQLWSVRRTFQDAAYCLGFGKVNRAQLNAQQAWGVRSARACLGSFAVLVAVVLGCVVAAYVQAYAGEGEPVLWLQGISVWPSELLRVLALLLVALFLFAACGKADQNLASVNNRFRLQEEHKSYGFRPRAIGRLPGSAETSEGSDHREPKTRLKVQDLWGGYADMSTPRWCLGRAAAWTAVFFVLAWAMAYLWGRPGTPARGDAAFLLDQLLMVCVVPGFLLILFFVADFTRLCDSFANKLSNPQVNRSWPKGLIEEYAADLGIAEATGSGEAVGGGLRETMRDRVVDAWLVVCVVAERSRAITPLVYFPFILLALIVVARWDAFDNWDMPVALIVVYASSLGISCFTAWFLQRTGNRVRNRCIAQLEECLLERRGDDGKWPPTDKQIEQLTERIRSLKQGAFAPFLEQPLVRAALLPFAGAGGLEIIGMIGLLP